MSQVLPFARPVRTAADALAWIAKQPGGRTTLNGRELGDHWNVTRQCVCGWKKEWVRAGLVTIDGQGRGRSIVAVDIPLTNLPTPVDVVDVNENVNEPVDIPLTPLTTGHKWLSSFMFFLAIVAAVVSLCLNALFMASFGGDSEASLLLSVFGVTCELMTIGLPSAVAVIWRKRQRILASVLLGLYFVALGSVLLISAGFAQQNIGDTVSGRGAVVDQRAKLEDDIRRLRREQSRLGEHTPILPEALQAATASRTQACKKPNSPQCAEAKIVESVAIRDRGITVRAEQLERLLPEKERLLATMPALSGADPQATAAVGIIAWVTWGAVIPTPTDIDRFRVLIIALTPIFSGLLFMGAMSLWTANAFLLGKRKKHAACAPVDQ